MAGEQGALHKVPMEKQGAMVQTGKDTSPGATYRESLRDGQIKIYA